MLVMSTIILLISNALTHIRELAILFSRSIMYLLFIICILIIDNFNLIFLSKGISIYSGLFFVKPYLETFSFFIYLITALILLLISYYPRSFLNPVKSQSQENVEIEKIVKNENLEQYKTIENSLLILFVLKGAILLMASDDLVSIILCLDRLSYGLYLLCVVYRNSEFSTKAFLTYFLVGGLSFLIFYRELKKISNLKWFLSKICKWFLARLCERICERILSYLWKNPILVKNISLSVFIHISLFIFNNQDIFLEHFFYTMDSFDSYTIMYDMFDPNFTWIDFYPTPLLGHKVNANANANTSNTSNSGNTSNTSNTGNNGDSGSGPNGGGGPSGHSGASGDNGNDSERKKSSFFSNLYPEKKASNKKPSAQTLKDEAAKERIRNDSISSVISQISKDKKKYGIEIDSNKHVIWGKPQEIDHNSNQYIRSDGDLFSKIGMFYSLYRTDLDTKYYRNARGARTRVTGRYEDIFPQDKNGVTHPYIYILHEYHKQVSKEYHVSPFREQINFDYLKRLNKNITND